MILKIRGAFLFYRQFLITSVLLNFLLFFFGNPVFIVVFIKVMLTTFVYYFYKTSYSKQLVFYQNLCMTSSKLFALALAFDFILVGFSAYIYSLFL